MQIWTCVYAKNNWSKHDSLEKYKILEYRENQYIEKLKYFKLGNSRTVTYLGMIKRTTPSISVNIMR